MSSSLTYTLRKRRTWPASSRRCGRNAGNFSSRLENSSFRLLALQSTDATPSVCRRNALGICTLIATVRLHSNTVFRDLCKGLLVLTYRGSSDPCHFRLLILVISDF